MEEGREPPTPKRKNAQKKRYGAFGGVIAEGELSSVQLKKIRKKLPNITRVRFRLKAPPRGTHRSPTYSARHSAGIMRGASHRRASRGHANWTSRCASRTRTENSAGGPGAVGERKMEGAVLEQHRRLFPTAAPAQNSTQAGTPASRWDQLERDS